MKQTPVDIDRFAEFLRRKSWLDKKLIAIGKWWHQRNCDHRYGGYGRWEMRGLHAHGALLLVCPKCDKVKRIKL